MNKILKRTAVSLLVLIALGGTAAYLKVRSSGHPQIDGEMKLAGLTAPVKVLRDELGVPYIFAANTPDLLRAQGFVTAQNRLMQMELFRATWRGELSASLGAEALPSDIRMRVLGIRRNGERHAEKLSPESKAFFQYYVDGINAYIKAYPDEHPIELKALGLVPQPWQVADLIALVHYVHYTHSTNFKVEVIAQKLIDHLGMQRAREIFPLTINPDWKNPAPTPPTSTTTPLAQSVQLNLAWKDLNIAPETLNHQGLGSNNWAVGPSRSQSGKAMVANDPHLDNRILPGTWHPIGLFTPEIQAVGAALPGMPGIFVGRNKHVAFGVTNAYGDVQDLYVETIDPADKDHYMDGGRSVPFTVINESIRIKDKNAPGGFTEQALKIRFTKRGPVITDHPGLGPKGDKLLVLRSTDAEVFAPQIGIEGLLTAANAKDFDKEVQKIDLMMFNFVFGDDQGNIAHRATGAVPIRSGADGGFPRLPPADGSDDWTAFIPKDKMPGMFNPDRAWVGTANHDTRPEGFPWYYTNYVSPNYRYTRIGQVLGATQKMTVEDHWKLMHDDRNLQSDILRPALIAALENDPANKDLAVILKNWDGRDNADLAAPLVYQALYRETVIGTFTDELGEELAKDMLSTWYFWQQRFDALLATPDSIWFDDVRTPNKRETLADVIRAAAPRARTSLEALQGKDTASWRWGKAHTVRFVSPLRRNGAGQELLGGFTVERSGSGETVSRGVYDFQKPYEAFFFASMQVIVDFGDSDKIEAALAGGVSERHFQPHQNDMAKLWAKNQRRPWWFAAKQVEAHASNRQTLVP
ncbi:penicillin acylase family protein [Undibacterium sp. Ji50W]|uniref:penicillin acylase family protein n=1 Tax=Undibacterium sp. Ji50W TaxID=3413041 RepID=UPI003BF2DD38